MPPFDPALWVDGIEGTKCELSVVPGSDQICCSVMDLLRASAIRTRINELKSNPAQHNAIVAYLREKGRKSHTPPFTATVRRLWS
jgi:hypothetical protein